MFALAAMVPAHVAAGLPGIAEPHAPAPRPSAVSVNPALQPLVDLAIADLVQRLGITRAAVSVTEAVTVVWPDRSLGCPRPGMQYPQVPHDGFLIRLQAQGRTFAYHGGGSRPPFLCESPDRSGPPAAPAAS